MYDHTLGLISFLWQRVLFAPSDLLCGKRITVHNVGEYDNGDFISADLEFDNKRVMGRVVVRNSDETLPNDTIAVLSSQEGLDFVNQRSEPIPRIVLNVPQHTKDKFARIVSGKECAEYLSNMNTIERIDIFNSLLTNRLRRKHDELTAIHIEGGNDWNYTLFVMLFRAMAGDKNKEAFTLLSKRIPYRAIYFERNSLESLEALLLGTSGMLFNYNSDHYTRRLNAEYEHLRNKYSIEPLRASIWDTKNMRPVNHPILRLTQIASFFNNRHLIFENVIKAKSVEDLTKLFCVQSSDYWQTHYTPEAETKIQPKSLGRDKALLLGINFVATLKFAYGKAVDNEELQQEAISLLENIPCEANSKTNLWREKGVVLESAFDSQAILELNNEFCKDKKCALCRVARRELSKTYKQF